MHRQCTTCGLSFPSEAFTPKWPHKCRSCQQAYQREYGRRRREHLRAYRRAWRLANPESTKRSQQKWKLTNAERMALVNEAGNAVHRALRAGLLTRPDYCEDCGNTGRIEAAHADYSRPLEVDWLCQPCHRGWDASEPKSI